MSTFVQLYYHIVFSTKNRKACLVKSNRLSLFKFIWGILKNKNCHLYRINGVEDHIHIFTHIHPSVSLSSLVKDIKVASNQFIKKEKLFPDFTGWQEGYGAFTHHVKDKNRLIEYVKNQEEHHEWVSWKDELKGLLFEHGIELEEWYLK